MEQHIGVIQGRVSRVHPDVVVGELSTELPTGRCGDFGGPGITAVQPFHGSTVTRWPGPKVVEAPETARKPPPPNTAVLPSISSSRGCRRHRRRPPVALHWPVVAALTHDAGRQPTGDQAVRVGRATAPACAAGVAVFAMAAASAVPANPAVSQLRPAAPIAVRWEKLAHLRLPIITPKRLSPQR